MGSKHFRGGIDSQDFDFFTTHFPPSTDDEPWLQSSDFDEIWCYKNSFSRRIFLEGSRRPGSLIFNEKLSVPENSDTFFETFHEFS